MTRRHAGRGGRASRARRAGAYAALAAVALLATGCGGGSDSDVSGGASYSTADEAPADRAAPQGAPADGARAGGDAVGGGATEGQAADRAVPAVVQRAEIATATVALSSPDVRATRNELQRIADGLQGIVGEEEASTDEGELVWTRMVLRVPTARYGDAVERIEEAATLVQTERSTEDVTTQVIDNEVRIRAQERSLRRVEVLLDRADRIADVVSIESELTRRQAELDSLKQQQAWLSDQTSLATITVHVTREGDGPPPADEDDDGFLAGLASGWDSLAGAAVVVATLAGVLLPWLVALGLLGLPVLWSVRRLPRRRLATAGAAPGDGPGVGPGVGPGTGQASG